MRSGSRLIVIFSCLGHLYIHLCTAFYFVIVLALEQTWQMPYHELIALWKSGRADVGKEMKAQADDVALGMLVAHGVEVRLQVTPPAVASQFIQIIKALPTRFSSGTNPQ